MTVRLKAAVAKPHEISWYRSPQVPLDSTLPPTAWCGFRTWHRGSALVHNSFRRSFAQWYSDNPEVEISEAELLVVDSDGIDIEDLPNLGARKPKILLLCSVPINPNVFKVGQEYSDSGGVCLTVIKPVGPHFLARALTKLLGNAHDLPEKPMLGPSIAPKLILGSALRNPKPRPSERALQALPIEDYSQLRVLVVEDNPVRAISLVSSQLTDLQVNRKVLSAFLRKRGCEFIEACDGVEGVEAFQKYPAGYFKCVTALIE
jgi:CheY-like chemotaxis protein